MFSEQSGSLLAGCPDGTAVPASPGNSFDHGPAASLREQTEEPSARKGPISRRPARREGEPQLTDRFRTLKVELLPVASLKPYARNPRTHSPRQVQQIADSICEFGFTNPVLIDADGGVIAGHGRIEAAKLLGIERVPTIRLDHMSEAQKRAYVLADNKLAENAGWDRELLALELQYLSELDLDFDLTITGFEAADIDVLVQGLDIETPDDPANAIPEVDESNPPVSRTGDLMDLGPASTAVRRCDQGGIVRAPSPGQKGADGFHRPAL